MTKRDIKFRAWDMLENKYWAIETWHLEDEYVDLIEPNKNVADMTAKRQWRNDSEVVIEQYTGLKDVNGVEIYEGDVAEMYLEEWDAAGNEDPKYYIGVVTFVNGSFVLKTKEYVEDQIFYYYDENSFVVIGNKWENPELLEV